MKRLMIFAAAAAVSALALAGGASAKSVTLSVQEQELCRLLAVAPESSCTEDADKLAADRNWVAKILDTPDEVTGSPLDETGGLPPQSLTQ